MSDLIEGHNGPWEVVLGLEVHAQVISRAKLFSGAATDFACRRVRDEVALIIRQSLPSNARLALLTNRPIKLQICNFSQESGTKAMTRDT